MSENHTPTARRARRDFVMAMLVHEIHEARTWKQIEDAADAMFHARLIWKGYDRECLRFESQGDGACEQAAPSEEDR